MRPWVLARGLVVIAFGTFIATLYLRPAPLSHHWSTDAEAGLPGQIAQPNNQQAARGLRHKLHAASPPVPKVALLFLTRGAMALEPAWREFMLAAGRVEPIDVHTFATKDVLEGLAAASVADAVAANSQEQGQLQHESSAGGERQRSLAASSSLSEGEQPFHLGSSDGATTRTQPQMSSSGSNSSAVSRSRDAQDLAGLSAVSSVAPQQSERPAARRLTADAQDHPGLSMDSNVGTAAALQNRLADTDAIACQRLFSVYVHSAPGYSYAPGNLFAGYEVPGRIQVHWGQHAVVEAERVLLRFALQEPLNQRFLLLSEACLPIYPPHTLYAQVLSEGYSRINACNVHTIEDARKRSVDRWHPNMESDQLDRSHWRKSSQFFSLMRTHAAIVAADEHVAPRFEAECYSYLPGRDDGLPVPPSVKRLLDQNITVAMRTCVSDEHYVPTVLAMHGLDEETDCLGMMTHAEWEWPSWSPKTYTPFEVTPQLVRRLRRLWFENKECDWQAAIRSADAMFRRRDSLMPLSQLHNRHQLRKTYKGYMPLDHACSLFARKFDISSIDPVLRMGAVCEVGFGWSKACV